MSAVGGWLDAIAHLIVIGWLYYLTARVQKILTHAEQAVANAAAVYEAVTDTAAEIAEADEPDPNQPTGPIEMPDATVPMALAWDDAAAELTDDIDQRLARFDFKEGHQR